MAKKKSIKYMQDYKEPVTRSRDGQPITHWMRINLTTEEACIISEMFDRAKQQEKPSMSLARAVILHMATTEDPDAYLDEALKKVKFRAALAEQAGESEAILALALMHEFKARKTTVPAPPTPSTQTTQKPIQPQSTKPPLPQPSKMRREYVPEPRRK